MRKNRTVDEYIAKLKDEIGALCSIVKHLEKARELYWTDFVGIGDHCRRHFLEIDRRAMDSDIRNAYSHIEWIRREIERARFISENRAWRHRMKAIGTGKVSPDCEGLPF